MKTEQLPFYDYFKQSHHNSYPSLPFEAHDYWFYMCVCVVLVAVVLFILWLIGGGIYSDLDRRRATYETKYGLLIDKRYVGEQTTSGSGTAIIPNTSGGVGIGVVSISSHSKEEFLFFVKADKVYKTEVNMQQFYSYNLGDNITIKVKIGGLSKEELKTTIVS